MKPGIAIVAILLFIGLIAIIGGGGYVAARSFTKSEKNRKLEFLGQTKPSPKLEARPSPLIIPTPAISPPPLTLSPSASPTPIASSELRYKQPHGKYTIILPAGWAVNNINSTSTYSTTKFTGPDGNISITFGSGKDPFGGCSETTNITLADRTIPSCYLLPKDGSQILTRTYTKDNSGIQFTIEAYINPPLASNKPVIVETIRTIDIN